MGSHQRGQTRRSHERHTDRQANYDPDAGVWYTESSDIHGLRIEAPSLEALIDRIPGAVQNLLEGEAGELDIPIEVIAHASTRLRVPQRA